MLHPSDGKHHFPHSVEAPAQAPLQVSYRLDNKRRNRVHGLPRPGVPIDTSVLADKASRSPSHLCKHLSWRTGPDVPLRTMTKKEGTNDSGFGEGKDGWREAAFLLLFVLNSRRGHGHCILLALYFRSLTGIYYTRAMK
jgi:hypothetical protein